MIGAGPAGLAAATLLAEQQARVLLLDEQPAPGGQIYRGIERAGEHASLLTALGATTATARRWRRGFVPAATHIGRAAWSGR